jgi:hypothetical protein
MMHARELAVEIPEADGAQQIGGPGSDFHPRRRRLACGG